ncbi:hypothetical protein [Oryzihumus sp.]|uniref:hypothetical protein n=1 Tax=Oryzihumus sp. TaxID=1968903 RepID=UPI002ED89735
MRIRSRVAIALFALALPAMTLGPAVISHAAPATHPTLSGPEAAAAAQMAQDWHLSWAEAMRRTQRQGAEEKLAGELAEHYPDRFAGAYVDHRNGGRLVVLSTSAIPVRAQAPQEGLDPATVAEAPARFLPVTPGR